MIHTGEKPHQSYCGKSFRTKNNKKLHKMTQTREYPHQCSYCDKSFPSTTQKKLHEMIHTGEKPHQCSYCVKSFRTMSEKKQHERTHIQLPQEYHYQCSGN